MRNCSVTWYAFDPTAVPNGKLALKDFNRVYYCLHCSRPNGIRAYSGLSAHSNWGANPRLVIPENKLHQEILSLLY